MKTRTQAAGSAAVIWAAITLVVMTAAFVTPADADLWGHLTFGRDILTSHTPILIDGYSFTSDRPWINHEWLSELTFAAIYRDAGSTGLILFKVAVIAALFGTIWRALRRAGLTRNMSGTLATLAFVGSYWRTHTIRPQLFSVLLFALLLLAIRKTDDGRPRWLALVPLIMAAWVNLHGGWIVGLGVFGLWAAWRVVGPGTPTKTRLVAIAAGLTALAATVVNPYGLDLWRFLAETVRLGRPDIEDWAPIWTSAGLVVPWVLVAVVAFAACWRGARRVPVEYAAVVVMLGAASMRVSRLDAFFAVAVAMLLGPAIAHAWTGLFAAARSTPTRTPPVAAAPVIAIAATAMLIPAIVLIRPYATCLTMTAAGLPEPSAAYFIRENHLTGRLLTWFDWGEYAIWFFGPDLQVSMDGRRETVYTERAIQAHRRFYRGEETGVPLVRELNPDYIWIPTHLPAVTTLRADGWRPIFDGTMSIVFARSGTMTTFTQAPSDLAGRRCFPGP